MGDPAQGLDLIEILLDAGRGLGSRFGQPEMDAAAVRRHKGIVAEVLAALDIVLVGICPVEFDLLALIRQRIDALLVARKGKKIALLVVAAKKVEEMGKKDI